MAATTAAKDRAIATVVECLLADKSHLILSLAAIQLTGCTSNVTLSHIASIEVGISMRWGELAVTAIVECFVAIGTYKCHLLCSHLYELLCWWRLAQLDPTESVEKQN